MSRRSIYLSIPKPCHEGWENMDATERGAFCHSCRKEVIDFSVMTDREVIEYLEKQKTGCGRFRKDQLDSKLTIPQVDNGVFRWRALFLSFLSLISIKNMVAQTTDKSSNKQNKTYRTDDSAVKHKSNPVCLPQVEVKAIAEKRETFIQGLITNVEPPLLIQPKDTVKKNIELSH